MKKVIKYFSVYLTVFAVLACTAFSFPVGASAALVSDMLFVLTNVMEGPVYFTTTGTESGDGTYLGSLYLYGLRTPASDLTVDPGTYIVHGDPYIIDSPWSPALQVAVIGVSEDSEYFVAYNYGEVITVPDTEPCSIFCQGFSEPSIEVYVEPEPFEPLYYSAFDMFANFIYGEGAELTAEQNMVLTILATSAALACVLLPFLIVFGIARRCGL